MKHFVRIFVVTFSVLFFYGCDDDGIFYIDHQPPSVPRGLEVFNLDEAAELYWDENRESDLAGYNIYVSDSYNGRYELIGSSTFAGYTDFGARNGRKYYYAVTAYDYDGNESELSYENAYAAPRPEGYNQSIFDYRKYPTNSGYDFSDYRVVSFDSQSADFFFEYFDGQYYLNVWDDTDIQDAGLTRDIYDITYAPVGGWSTTKDAIAQVGHTYIIWTWDNHYAKIRIKNITRDRIVFDWAYQLIEGEPTMKPKAKNGNRILKRSSLLNR